MWIEPYNGDYDGYSFTWATRSFYKKDTRGNVKKMKAAPKPREFAREVVKSAPNFVSRMPGPSKEIKIKRMVKPVIETVDGLKHYYKTEVEDSDGNWNDNYSVRDGFWVIHEGKYHHVYK